MLDHVSAKNMKNVAIFNCAQVLKIKKGEENLLEIMACFNLLSKSVKILFLY